MKVRHLRAHPPLPAHRWRVRPRLPRASFGHARRSRGQALVELALIVPVILLLLVAAGDLARVFAAQMTVESAARAGAMEAAKHPTSFVAGAACDPTLNSVMCAVLTESSGGAVTVGVSNVSLACNPSPCVASMGNYVSVTVRGTMQLLTPILAPFFGGSTMTTTSTASAQLAVKPNILPAGSQTPSPTPSATPTPTPNPTATPTPDPFATPTPTPSATPTPSPTPFCNPPSADFWINPSSGRHQDPFTFHDNSWASSGCSVTSWSWNFGDGAGQASTSSLQNPSHTYAHKGTYLITLVASNWGGSDTAYDYLYVNP